MWWHYFLFVLWFLLEGWEGGGLGQHMRILFWLFNMQVESKLSSHLPILNVDNNTMQHKHAKLNLIWMNWYAYAKEC